MRQIDINQFNDIVEQIQLKPRLKRELRFIVSTEKMTQTDWDESELVAIKDRSGKQGVLLVSLDSTMYALQYELTSGVQSSFTGRAQPIICDFCYTWQSGTRAAVITFPKSKQNKRNSSYLCCDDLRCSDHARSKTEAARMSRAQLREDLTDEDRIKRLMTKTARLLKTLQVEPVTL